MTKRRRGRLDERQRALAKLLHLSVWFSNQLHSQIKAQLEQTPLVLEYVEKLDEALATLTPKSAVDAAIADRARRRHKSEAETAQEPKP